MITGMMPIIHRRWVMAQMTNTPQYPLSSKIRDAYPNCHPRTLWYLGEVAYCLEKYFAFSANHAELIVVNSPYFQDLVGGEYEKLLWHDMPLELAYKEALLHRPDTVLVNYNEINDYVTNRFFNPPPEAKIS